MSRHSEVIETHDNFIFKAYQNKDREATTSLREDSYREGIRGLRLALRGLGVSRFDYRIVKHRSGWPKTGRGINVDPNSFGRQVTLKLSKVAIEKLMQRIHD